MSNNRSAPPAGFAAWFASASRQVSSTSPPVKSELPPSATVIADTNKLKGTPMSPNVAQTLQTLGHAAAPPNRSDISQQIDSRPDRGMNHVHQTPHNANSHQVVNGNFGRAQQGRRHSARGQGPARPIDMNGLFRGMDNLAVGGLRTVSAPAPDVPLTKFTIFERLPAELRLRIWGHALNTERILEVIWDGAERDPNTASHYYYRLSPRSCARPALMDVCPESRAEAERFYTLVDFTTTAQHAAPGFVGCGPMKTYFSPKLDILLFGEHSCMWSIVRLLQDLRNASVDVHRVAIVSSGQLLRCHDWNHDDPAHGPDQMAIDHGLAIAGGCSTMQALHGIHKDVALTDMVAGVKGLKEVYWVVPTHLIPGIAGKVDESIGFRTARGSGLTTGQVRVKNSLQGEADLIEAGSVLPGCSMDDSMNNWAGDDKPDFKFVTFAPKSHLQGMFFNSMIIVTNDLPKLNGNDWQFIKNVERWTGCHVKIPRRDYPTQLSREIGLYGTKSGIESAKKHIRDRLVHLSGSNWTVPKHPKIVAGYSRSLDLEVYIPGATASLY